MTTLIRQRGPQGSSTMPTSADLVTALLPWRRRLTHQQTLRLLAIGSIAALFLACLVLFISRFIPWPTASSWALGIALLCLASATFLSLRYRPSLARTSQLVDQRLFLHDRLGTAWELRDETSIIAGMQRRDALKHLRDFSPATAIALRPARATLLTIFALGVALLLLIMLHNPMDTLLRQQADLHARISKQVATVEHIRQELTHEPGLTKAQQQQLDQILQNLESKLQQAKSDTEAQQAVAQAQSKIEQMQNPQTAQNMQGHNAASNALQGSNDPALKALGQALANNDAQGIANALQKLADEVNKMTPQQRGALAQQLEEAANQASQNSQLSSALHNLAKSLTDGNSSEQADASKALQSAAAQDAQNQANQQGLNQASQNVQQVANNLASSTDGTQNQQAQSQSQSQGQGQQSGQQGQTSSTSDGKTGQQQGQGQQGQGQQGQGGGNGTKGSNSAGNNTGKDEQVYVPGQVGTGTSQQSSGQNSNTVESGSNVPYSQVIAQYDQMAHDAIDNSDISPDLKDLVQQYFDSLEGH